MNNLTHFFYDLFIEKGLSETNATFLNMLSLLILLVILIFTTDFITRKILVQAFSKFADRTTTQFDNLLIKHKAPRNLAHLVPLLLTIELFPIVFNDYPSVEQPIETLLKIYGVLLFIWILRSILKTLESYFKTIPSLKDKPIDSYVQVGMLGVWIVGIAFCFVIITDITLIQFFTTLGAASAVLLLIFKDTILGFVASINVAVNDTVRIGDWITMEKYGADGDVIEINLNTIQVQNFDKTITNIPTGSLMTDAFTNWRGMSDSGGRRIKRAIIIKATSIKYLAQEEIDDLRKIQLISDYVSQRQEDINHYNREKNIDKSVLINGRNLTNFGVFRKYIQNYIEGHSAINKDMTIMTRQLAPTPQGIPLEIYAFSSDKRWENYEYIMADIFDHLLAAVPYFKLEIFELQNFDPNVIK
ncbi:mechanosensitive ion channel family protein [Mangrovimonas sp. AS39]|uniref:mechanosensitive ion channel family protein n=1 Tax=Mangrovimonas futianensis TaxID=2895523 RepID=UPI001E58A81D|nr:mechanosensitive ion channel domain-containing protein [Mangrovimonas futianensis]MCF1191728.1 mechanosensitive ion channel family protein [Mangrovimonas futianensis]MCF1195384.1 mechanosensitive ion channel family protein [Mangrovimonas futianensis]